MPGNSDDRCIKLSKIITKSKFGAPSKVTQRERYIPGNLYRPLPPISSLQINGGHNNFLRMNILPNDYFSRIYGEATDPAFETLLTLTPPSSPIATCNEVDALKDESKQKERSTTVVSENVDNLVDEHFRNCGIDQYASKSKDQNEYSGFLQRFLNSQVNIITTSYSIPKRSKE